MCTISVWILALLLDTISWLAINCRIKFSTYMRCCRAFIKRFCLMFVQCQLLKLLASSLSFSMMFCS